MIVAGLFAQGIAISIVGVADSYGWWLAALTLLGLGTAMVYPTLLAAIGDVVHPLERATTMGVYRFWRDARFRTTSRPTVDGLLPNSAAI